MSASVQLGPSRLVAALGRMLLSRLQLEALWPVAGPLPAARSAVLPTAQRAVVNVLLDAYDGSGGGVTFLELLSDVYAAVDELGVFGLFLTAMSGGASQLRELLLLEGFAVADVDVAVDTSHLVKVTPRAAVDVVVDDDLARVFGRVIAADVGVGRYWPADGPAPLLRGAALSSMTTPAGAPLTRGQCLLLELALELFDRQGAWQVVRVVESLTPEPAVFHALCCVLASLGNADSAFESLRGRLPASADFASVVH